MSQHPDRPSDHASSHAADRASSHASNPPSGSPWMYIAGFVISIALTLGALWLALARQFSTEALLTVILILAILQIGVQMFFFMHVTESPRPQFNLWILGLGMFFTFVVIASSIWIMSFGGALGY